MYYVSLVSNQKKVDQKKMAEGVAFSIHRSKEIEEVEEGTEYETLSKCFLSTMHGAPGIIVHELLSMWSKPEYADSGFQFSVGKTSILSHGPEKTGYYVNTTSVDNIMRPFVDAGYIEFHFRVRNGKAATKGGSSWVYTYKAVSMVDALQVAKKEFNQQVRSSNVALNNLLNVRMRATSVTVGIISDPRAGRQKSQIKKRLKAIGKDRDKSLFFNFMTSAETNPLKGGYYDAVFVVGKTQGARQVFEARKEMAKRKKLDKKEMAFDNEDEFIEYVDARLNKKRKRK